jgi:hypothetical protein
VETQAALDLGIAVLRGGIGQRIPTLGRVGSVRGSIFDSGGLPAGEEPHLVVIGKHDLAAAARAGISADGSEPDAFGDMPVAAMRAGMGERNAEQRSGKTHWATPLATRNIPSRNRARFLGPTAHALCAWRSERQQASIGSRAYAESRALRATVASPQPGWTSRSVRSRPWIGFSPSRMRRAAHASAALSTLTRIHHVRPYEAPPLRKAEVSSSTRSPSRPVPKTYRSGRTRAASASPSHLSMVPSSFRSMPSLTGWT